MLGINYAKISIWLFIICLTFSGSQWIAAHAIHISVLIGTTTALVLSLATGINLIAPVRSEKKLCALYCLVTGSLLTSVILMMLTLATGNFKFSVIVLIVGNIIAALKNRQPWLNMKLSNAAIAASILGIVAMLCWSQENIACLAIKPNLVINRPWQDIFYHTSNITLFAQANGAHSLHSPNIRNSSLPIYHYGAYMLASLILLIAKTSAISIASGFFIPYGFFLTVCTAYCFGAMLFTKTAGLFAAMAVSLIPDPASLHLVTSYFGYYFFQAGVGGNAPYGVACFTLAWLSLFAAYQANRTKNLILAACFFALLCLFKVQIFLVYSGLFCSFFLFCLFQKPKTRFWTITSFWLLYFMVVHISKYFPTFPTLRFSRQGASIMVLMLESFNCVQPIAHWVNINPHYLCKLAIGLPLYAIATYGFWLPLVILAIVLGLKSDIPKRFVLFIVLTLVNNGIVAFALAPNIGYGDFYEVIHKTFIWPIFILTVCSACLVYSSLADKTDGFILSVKWKCLLAISLVLLVFSAALLGKTTQRNFSGGTNKEFPRGLYDCATFLRENSSPGSTVQLCGNDDYQFLMVCAERFPFVCQYSINSPPISNTMRDEIAEMISLPSKPFTEAKQTAYRYQIDWLIVDLKTVNGKPFRGTMDPTYSSKDYQVYKMVPETAEITPI